MRVDEIINLAILAKVGLFLKDGRLGIRAEKGKLNPELKNEIQKNKEAIIRYLKQQEAGLKVPAILPRKDRSSARLSYSQQRLWFVDQLDGRSCQYNIPAAFRFNGVFDVACCQRALAKIIERHEILRTNVRKHNGEAFQVIQENVDFILEHIDSIGESNHKQNLALEKSARSNAEQYFDLENGLMFRATLVHLSDNHGVIFMCMHHIAADGWSLGIFLKEFSTLYTAYIADKAEPLAPLEIQYADFAEWQRDCFSGDIIKQQLDYWKTQLEGVSPLHGLPLDKTRPATQSQVGQVEHQSLNHELSDRVREYCRKHDVTLFMFLQSAFSILLYRYTGESEVVMGTPIAGRVQHEVEPLIGFFLNNLVIRNHIDGVATFKEVLLKNKETILDAYENQLIPFDILVDALKVERSLSYNPLFQIKINLNNTQSGNQTLPGLELSPYEIDLPVSTTGLDLALDIFDNPNGLSFLWTYNSDLFDSRKIKVLLESFENLLISLLELPDESINCLPLLSKIDQQMLLHKWNPSESHYQKERCIHELFEVQANRQADSEAVVYDGESLSYGELNRQANQLAHRLIELGVKPNQLLGLCVDRSFDMMVGILAILKAGACYVGIDPDYPEQRINHIIEDSSIEIILTQNEFISESYIDDLLVIPIDEYIRDVTLASYSEENIDARSLNLTSRALAYVIYTSGSTGLPKGVALEHGGIVNLAAFFADNLEISEKDRVLQFASIGFDAAVWEWVMALSAGASLHIATESQKMDADNFSKLISSNKITCATLPPTYLNTLKISGLESLRKLIFAGEALDVLGINKLSDEIPDCQIYNAYGPTEATVCSTIYPVSGVLEQRVPIGKPIANTQAFVMSQAQQLLPLGAVGELCVASPGLAREYINQKSLSQDKFIDWTPPEGATIRLYKTGDLAHWSMDGNLEFIGRIDHQVKLRGFRVELGEIESQLIDLDAIEKAVVLIRPNNANTTMRLVAYIITSNAYKDEFENSDNVFSVGDEALVVACRTHLKAKLPDYMVPDVFTVLEYLPLTSNGKIDRELLPAPSEEDLKIATYEAASNKQEEALCQIWQEVLGLDTVGIHDDFFGLGGDSIVSIQVVSRAKLRGLHFAVRDIFDKKTIAELSSVVKLDQQREIIQGAVEGKMSLLPIQIQFFNEVTEDIHHYNQSMLLQAPFEFNYSNLKDIVEAMVRRHDVLRLSFVEEGGVWTAEYKKLTEEKILASIGSEDLSSFSEQEKSVELENRGNRIQRSLNLEHGSLFRIVYFNYGQGHGRLMLVLHHLVMDGVSWRILLSDLELAYQQQSQMKAIILQVKTSSFQEWVHALSEYAQGSSLQQEREFWVQQLAEEVTSFPMLSTEGVEELRQVDMDITGFTLTKRETLSLLGECNDAYRTQTNELLLAALLLAAEAWTGQTTLRLCLEGHGREELFSEIDHSETLGWFTSVYPFMLSGYSERGSGEIIKAVKEQCRAVPNRGIGFGVLKYLTEDELIVSMDSASKSNEVIFNYLGQFDNNINDESAFSVAKDTYGSPRSSKCCEPHLLSIDCVVMDGVFKCSLKFSKIHIGDQQSEKFMREYKFALQNMISTCELAVFEQSNFNRLNGLNVQPMDKIIIQTESFEI